MAEFIYTTSTAIGAPILIDADKLEALDKLIDDEYQRLHERLEKRLNAEVREKLESESSKLRRLADNEGELEELIQKRKTEITEELKVFSFRQFNESRSLTIHLKVNKKVKVSNFGEALRQQPLLDETPVGFALHIQSGEITCEITLRQNGVLDVSVSPEHLPESRELFAALQRWAYTIHAPTWQRLWVEVKGLIWVLWLLALLVGIIVAASGASGGKRVYKQQAIQLLKDGLSPDEQLKATEIILALQSDYVPEGQGQGFPGWFLLLFFGGLIMCIILSITPPPLIGIGKGQEMINRWRWWMRFVFIAAPAFLFINILWPFISRFIGLP